MTEIDDDRIAFLLICVVLFAAIIGVCYSYQQILFPPPPKKASEVLILQSPNLEQKQILLMPMPIPGRLTEDSPMEWICHVYNPKSFNQTVEFTWSLAFQMEEEAKYVSFYSSLGQNFTVNSWECLECHLSFSIKDETPAKAVKKLGNTEVWLDVRSEVIE